MIMALTPSSTEALAVLRQHCQKAYPRRGGGRRRYAIRFWLIPVNGVTVIKRIKADKGRNYDGGFASIKA
jgi:hypothetical protein